VNFSGPGNGEEQENTQMLTLTAVAIGKVKEIMAERGEQGGLRIAIIGGGCSGFQYQMSLDTEPDEDDKVIEMGDLKVFVDSRSVLYLEGTKVDYVEGLNGSGFKFDNPNSRGTCGCGESFNA
jgi:iron-sulfur cluster assembly protein